jgi:hypothetical protein
MWSGSRSIEPRCKCVLKTALFSLGGYSFSFSFSFFFF